MAVYATKEQLKALLGITGAEQDTYLDALLSRASAFIESYTGRSWSATESTVTDELYDRKGRIFWLRASQVSDVTSVKVRDSRTDSWTTLSASSYEWTSAGRIELALDYTFVQVSYTTPGAEIPADIQAAALEIAADAYRSGGEQGAVRSTKVGDVSITYASSETTSAGSLAMLTLDYYRVRAI